MKHLVDGLLGQTTIISLDAMKKIGVVAKVPCCLPQSLITRRHRPSEHARGDAIALDQLEKILLVEADAHPERSRLEGLGGALRPAIDVRIVDKHVPCHRSPPKLTNHRSKYRQKRARSYLTSAAKLRLRAADHAAACSRHRRHGGRASH
jgi:hypothetical protein